MNYREFFMEKLLVPIHFIIVMIRWTGLAPWNFEVPFSGSLTSTFLGNEVKSIWCGDGRRRRAGSSTSGGRASPSSPGLSLTFKSVSLSIYLSIYLSIDIHRHIYRYIHISVYIYINVYLSIHACIHICIYIYIYICINIHTLNDS